MKNSRLQQALNEMRIEPDGARLTFPERLAQENGWSLNFANRVFEEYKHFLYIAVTSGRSVTPSDEVDQAWHLHLTYSRHYWEILCPEILEMPFHHGPTAGGPFEQDRYRGQYDTTLALYLAIVGVKPPSDIWPDTDTRFGTPYRRVPIGQHWMVPKKMTYAMVPLLGLAACTSSDAVAGSVVSVMAIIVVVIVATRLSAEFSKTNKKEKKDSGCGSASGCSSSNSNSSSGNSGCGGGGCGGCGG